MSLVSKFENVNIDWRNIIPQEDQAILKTIEDAYQRVFSQLNDWHNYISNSPLPSNPCITIESYIGREDTYVHFDYSLYDSKDRFFDRYMFSPAYAQQYITSVSQKITNDRNQRIVRYFNNKYCLDIDLEDENSHNNLDKVINSIIRLLDGHSFHEYAVKVWRESLSGFQPPIVSKSKVVFSRIWLTSSDSWDNSSSSSFSKILRALSYLENGEVNVQTFSGALGRQSVYTYLIPLGGTKVSGFKYFKSRKLELTFSSQEYAQEFASYFR